MGTFGSSLWGAGGASSSTAGTAGVPLSSLIMPAYRIAGITQRAMIGPSPDMYAEAIPELNRLLGSWNCDGHKIYSTAISAPFLLTAGVKTYTIGLTGAIAQARPVFIKGADLLYPTSPIVRQAIYVTMDSAEWQSIAVQDVTGAPPYLLYYDAAMDANGNGTIYLLFQPPAGYKLELYTWQALQSSFAVPTDVAVFPPGYEFAIVYNLAKSLAALNPNMANMSPESYAIARSSLATLISLNSKSPRMDCEPGLSRETGSGYGWLNGPFR